MSFSISPPTPIFSSSSSSTTTSSSPLSTVVESSTTAPSLRPPHKSAPVAPTSFFVRPAKKRAMSITQTYYLAHKARAKLSSEASRPDHDLRLLVGHANLLDSLMVELADAEREQEMWFNQSVRGATYGDSAAAHWDGDMEEPEDDWHAEDADSDSSSSASDDAHDDDQDVTMADAVSLRRVLSRYHTQYQDAMEEDPSLYEHAVVDDEDEDEEEYAQLVLVHSPSYSATQSITPPELDLDSESSDDEPMPPSPPTLVLPSFSENPSPGKVEDEDEEEETRIGGPNKNDFYQVGFYLPPRNPARLLACAQ